MSLPEAVVNIRNLQIVSSRQPERPIVEDLSLSIHPGEMLAVVGESGSGKSMTASAIIGLMPDLCSVTSGSIEFQGDNIVPWTTKKRRTLCGSRIGYVFQDYKGSFSPFVKIGKQLVETLRAHHPYTKHQAKEMVLAALEECRLPSERVFNSYSFQLSGGQLQRAALSAVLILRPDLLIADEPTTALDVINGELVLDLIKKVQDETGCAVMLISHDLRLVLSRADQVAVMKDGKVIECQPAHLISAHAEHEYTRELLSSCPTLDEHDHHSHMI